MADIKVSALPQELSPKLSDVLMLLSDETTTFISKQVTLDAIAELVLGQQEAEVLEQTINVTVGSDSGQIFAGVATYLVVPYDCEVIDCWVLSKTSATITFGIWRATYAEHPADSSASIVGTGNPALTAETKSQANLANWDTTTLTEGDILTINVGTSPSAQLVTLSLKVRRT